MWDARAVGLQGELGQSSDPHALGVPGPELSKEEGKMRWKALPL